MRWQTIAISTMAALLVASSAAAQCRRDDVDTLVDRCLRVSPATHPPCNAENSCGLIISEVRRGCEMLSGEDRPGFCDEVR